MSTHDRDIVKVIRAALAESLGAERFSFWFGDAELELAGDRLTVNVGAQLLQFIRGSFRQQLTAACAAAGLAAVTFDYVARPEPPAAKPKREPRAATRKPCVTRDLLPAEADATPTGAERPTGQIDAVDVPAGNRTLGAATAGPRRPSKLDAFYPGENNKLAAAVAETAALRPGQFSPLVFFGPTGVGKSVLLDSIAATVRQLNRKATVLYLTAEQFTTQFCQAIRGTGVPNLRNKYRDVDVLLIDDLQFFVDKRATKVELLNTVEQHIRAGRQLVLAADRPPAELAELGEELITRLQAGMLCEVFAPDMTARRQIVAQTAKRMGVHVPADVQEYIAARFTRHGREISGALCRLQAIAEATGQPLSLALAEQSLSDLLRYSNRLVKLADIERVVCDVFGIEPARLQAADKNQGVSHPRMLAMWLARKHTREALSEIGRFFGRRSHSTVVSAEKRVSGWVAAGAQVHLADRTWQVDEAIRHLERRLAVG